MDGQHDVDSHLVQAFIALQMTGGVGFTLILFSALLAQRHGIRRHLTWFSFCISWIVFCVSYALLTLAGQQSAHPQFSLCVVQSALVYAAPPLAGSATVSLVVHLLLNVLSALSESPTKKRTSSTAALVLFPWITWVAVVVGVLVYGLQHPDNVEKSFNGTYCVVVKTAIPKLTSIWAMVASAMILGGEIIIGVLLYRNRDIIAGFGQSLAMAIRVGIFTSIGIAAIVVALIYTVTARRGVEFDVLIAALPALAAVIFGSQRDLFRAWIFWKRNDTESEGSRNGATPATSVAFTSIFSHLTSISAARTPTPTEEV